jgi:glyoxylase-like metal-dependent hydrolase (beta-lactamase superfamily II)
MITKLNLTIANVHLIDGPKPVVVDTGAPGSAPKILAALARQGFAPTDVALILLTHAHSDHAGSAAALRQATDAPVAVHRGDLAMLRRGDNGKVFPTDLEARISQPFVDKPFPALEPDIILDNQSDLRALGLDAELLPTPGHSPGSISMLFANGDAIIGDILRGGIMGGAFLAARPNYPFFLYDLADKRVILESVQAVLDAGAQRLYTGHGGPLPRQAVAEWLEKQHQQARSGR